MKRLLLCAWIAAVALPLSARANPDVLLIWDDFNTHTQALVAALNAAGINVTPSDTAEYNYNGANPAPDSFDAVIHLNGTTYSSEMDLAGQQALMDFVIAGGGYIHGEWNAYQINNGQMNALRDLVLFDRSSGSEGTLTYTLVPGMETHPVVASSPLSFSFQAGRNDGYAHVFAVDPVEVLATDDNGNDAIAVRELGSARIVGFNHAGNYSSYSALSNADIQQLFVDAIYWVADIDEDLDGWSPMDGDCDDGDDTVYPGAPEVCNDGIDQNCDGELDEITDNDGDGLSQCAGDCDDTDASRFPGAVEVCDHFDTDCDGDVDEGFDLDGDGYFLCDDPPDCNDGDPTIYPGAAENCNGVDDDCDNDIDEILDDDGDR